MKKYVSLTDIEDAIKNLDRYKDEHHRDGELYYALSIAVHIMRNVLNNVIDEMMETGDRYDS